MKKTISTRAQLNRLVVIHNLLSKGLRYDLADFQLACERDPDINNRPSVRTLYGDLERLRGEYRAPLAPKNKSRKPYWYTKSFSLFGVLNPKDAALANEAAALLKQVSHLPQFRGLEDVFLKFEQRASTLGSRKLPAVQFEQNPDYKGLRWLGLIYEAMEQDRQLWVSYKPFVDDWVTISFSPYLLKEYSNRWHVYGYGAESIGLNSLALDRIESLKIRPDQIRQQNTTDWGSYLADVVGFTRYHNEAVNVWILRVYKPRAFYVDTKPLHTSQTCLAETEQYMDFRYELRWNKELDSKIFELGPDAELLEPTDKRAEFAEKVKRLMERYR